MNNLLVSIVKDPGAGYPVESPFHPDTANPEYVFDAHVLSKVNQTYAAVRQTMARLGLDSSRFGQRDWNPLGDVVAPGQTIVIKPNLVLDRHPRGGDLNCLITHGSVIRAILDYVFIALKGRGRVIIGDSPLQTTDFQAAARASGIASVVEWYRAHTPLDVRLVDYRQVHTVKDERGHVVSWREAPGDPAGYVTFDLGPASMLTPIERDSQKFRVANYKTDDTLQYHGPASHKYVIARSIIDADVIISVPKMKTHCKVGVTLSLKNFVGTVGRKQCLAHHREGGADEGGDEFPGHSRLKRLSERLERRIDGHSEGMAREFFKFGYRVNERLIREFKVDPTRDGGWHGNDTAWRMTLDLDRIALYGRHDGHMGNTPQRKILTLVDGIVAGENEGPLEATPRLDGCVIGSLNPLAADLATATLMGFAHEKIPLLLNATNIVKWPIMSDAVENLIILLNEESLSLLELAESDHRMDFAPAMGWMGHIELQRRALYDVA